jgi:glutamate-1-semialdehyde 2,1-aminomutase
MPAEVTAGTAGPTAGPAAYRLDESARLLARARQIDAGFALRPGVIGSYGEDETVPVFADRAEGPYVWDVDGNRYVDLVLGFGGIVLGHGHPAVTEAVEAELARGVSPTLHRPAELELIELLISVIPGAEMAMLLKTGSDATDVAVRIARAHTGRAHVLRWGYHGWHDWSAPRPGGLAPGAQDFVGSFPYNDLAGLERELAHRSGDVACVSMMPLELEPPPSGYLGRVRELAHRHGALFVLDESRTGFRLALGGAQEYFGVRADLVVLGKAMANGHPMSAIAGRRDVLAAAGRVSFSSLGFRSGDGIAAALATIGLLQESSAIETLWDRGRQLVEGLRAAAGRQRVPVEVVGLPLMPHQVFRYAAERDRRRAAQAFYAESRAHGALFHPSHQWFTCAAMSPDDIELAVRAAESGYAAARLAVAGDGGRAGSHEF